MKAAATSPISLVFLLLLALSSCYASALEKALPSEQSADRRSLRGGSISVGALDARSTDKSGEQLVLPTDLSREQAPQSDRRLQRFSLSPTSAPIPAPSSAPTSTVPRVMERPEIDSYNVPEREPCGLFHKSIFCPTTFQGVIGRFLAKYLD